MNIRLLKINAMKRFGKWFVTRSVAVDQWEDCNPLGGRWKAFERRQEKADARDRFVKTRMKTRPGWRMMFLRYEQSSKTLNLINYILKRYFRRKKK